MSTVESAPVFFPEGEQAPNPANSSAPVANIFILFIIIRLFNDEYYAKVRGFPLENKYNIIQYWYYHSPTLIVLLYS